MQKLGYRPFCIFPFNHEINSITFRLLLDLFVSEIEIMERVVVYLHKGLQKMFMVVDFDKVLPDYPDIDFIGILSIFNF